MSALFRIVYAAHANGTHHKLALDALRHLQRGDADAWQRVFLKHVAAYLEGSKAPDTIFKDFKNHVLHVGDKYWGGAPEKVEAWYRHTVDALRAEKWADAAYAAGVLSHYYTDPIHPFHTGQTEAENAIHRACEWSITRSYNSLRALAESKFADLNVVVPEGPHWQREMVCDGAEYAHRYYEKLIAHYDIHVGTVRPEEGLDDIARTCVAELLFYAAEGFGHILDRAISEAGVAPPQVNLTIDTVLAAMNVPAKWVEKKLSNDADKAIVRAMYDELKATGRVEHALPEDDRVVRDLYAREVLAPKLAARSATRAQRVPAGDPSDVQRRAEAAPGAVAVVKPAASAGAVHQPLATQSKRLDEPAFASIGPQQPVGNTPPVTQMAPLTKVEPITRVQPDPKIEPATTVEAARATVVDSPPTPKAAALQPFASITATQSVPQIAKLPEPRKSYLSLTDDLEAAPSIGTRMAEAFAALGITTVAEFLGQNPSDMAELLDDSRCDSETLTDWQDQAQLVIEVPGLRGTHAQLLVGAGYRTADAIADADPVELSADVLTFANSSDGRRVLRDGNPPDLGKIKEWLDMAQQAIAA